MQNYRKGERISRIYFVYLHILTSGLRDTGSSVPRKRGGKTAETATSHRRKGSGMGRSVEELKRLAPNSIIKDGLSIRGTLAHSSDQLIQEWLEK